MLRRDPGDATDLLFDHRALLIRTALAAHGQCSGPPAQRQRLASSDGSPLRTPVAAAAAATAATKPPTTSACKSRPGMHKDQPQPSRPVADTGPVKVEEIQLSMQTLSQFDELAKASKQVVMVLTFHGRESQFTVGLSPIFSSGFFSVSFLMSMETCG